MLSIGGERGSQKSFEKERFRKEATHRKSRPNLLSTFDLVQFVNAPLSPDKIAPEKSAAKMCLVVNNSAVKCPISLQFGTEFDHVTADTLQVFGVKRSNVDSHGKCSLIAKISVLPYRKLE